jgi:hypothetical protein
MSLEGASNTVADGGSALDGDEKNHDAASDKSPLSPGASSTKESATSSMPAPPVASGCCTPRTCMKLRYTRRSIMARAS